MLDQNDYSNLSLEELVTKQKSLSNSQKKFIAIAVVLAGMTLYLIYKHTLKMHPFLMFGSIFLILDNGNKLKKVEKEIKNRKG